jgi:hypothetical protein
VINRAVVSFREPYLFDRPISLGVSGYTFSRLYPDFNESRGGGRFSLGRQFGTQTYADVALRVEDVGFSGFRSPAPADFLAASGHTFLSTLRPSVRFDNRNDPFVPSKGQYLELAFEQGWGDFTFPKFTAEGRQHFTLGSRPDQTGKRILTMRGFYGISGRDTPVYERFYAGDFRSMRGFAYRGVGPPHPRRQRRRDHDGRRVGRVPVPLTANDQLQAVVFSDFGTVEPDYNFTTFRAAVGTGLRVVVPALGPLPLAFDLAFPVSGPTATRPATSPSSSGRSGEPPPEAAPGGPVADRRRVTMPVWLVTGGSGFLGGHLLAALARSAPADAEVVALGRRCPAGWPPGAFLHADLEDEAALGRAVAAAAPAVVLHAAGLTPPAAPGRLYRANTLATLSLLEALRAARPARAGRPGRLGGGTRPGPGRGPARGRGLPVPAGRALWAEQMAGDGRGAGGPPAPGGRRRPALQRHRAGPVAGAGLRPLRRATGPGRRRPGPPGRRRPRRPARLRRRPRRRRGPTRAGPPGPPGAGLPRRHRPIPPRRRRPGGAHPPEPPRRRRRGPPAPPEVRGAQRLARRHPQDRRHTGWTPRIPWHQSLADLWAEAAGAASVS